MYSSIRANDDDINGIKKIQQDILSAPVCQTDRLITYINTAKSYILEKYENNNDINEVLNCIDEFTYFCSNHYPVSRNIDNINVLSWNTENIGMLHTYFILYVTSKNLSGVGVEELQTTETLLHRGIKNILKNTLF